MEHYKLDNVYCVDCIEGLSNVQEDSIDLVFADPPFNIGKQYDKHNDNIAKEEYIDWCADWISRIYNVVKPNGGFWLAINDENAAELKILSENVGFYLKNWIIWYYTFGMYCKRKFARSHTHLLHFTKDNDNFTFNDDDVRVPSARQLKYNDKRANKAGKIPDNVWIIQPENYDLFKDNEDTWQFSRVCGTFKERTKHPCQMPIKLLERIIKVSTNIGDVILDPFVGSGTTVVAAKILRRKYLGFDISENYIRITQERLHNV